MAKHLEQEKNYTLVEAKSVLVRWMDIQGCGANLSRTPVLLSTFQITPVKRQNLLRISDITVSRMHFRA